MFRKTVLALLLAAAGVNAHATLSAGDIAFTSFNADEDGWSIVALAEISASTTVYFRDDEWNGSSFNSGEGLHTWNSGTTSITAGTVIRFSKIDQAIRSVNFGSLSSTGDTGLNASSETIYAYTGANINTPTTFLAGISSEGSTNLTSAGLVSGNSAIVVTNSTDFASFNGMRSGEANFAAYRSTVNNAANWNIIVGGDQANQVPNTTAFTVTAVPEPKNYAMFLAGLGLMGLIARRKGKN